MKYKDSLYQMNILYDEYCLYFMLSIYKKSIYQHNSRKIANDFYFSDVAQVVVEDIGNRWSIVCKIVFVFVNHLSLHEGLNPSGSTMED